MKPSSRMDVHTHSHTATHPHPHASKHPHPQPTHPFTHTHIHTQTHTKGRNMNYVQKFYQILFIFYQFNKFISSKQSNFTAKLTILKEKKSLSSAMTIKQWKFSMLYCHYYTFLPE